MTVCYVTLPFDEPVHIRCDGPAPQARQSFTPKVISYYDLMLAAGVSKRLATGHLRTVAGKALEDEFMQLQKTRRRGGVFQSVRLAGLTRAINAICDGYRGPGLDTVMLRRVGRSLIDIHPSWCTSRASLDKEVREYFTNMELAASFVERLHDEYNEVFFEITRVAVEKGSTKSTVSRIKGVVTEESYRYVALGSMPPIFYAKMIADSFLVNLVASENPKMADIINDLIDEFRIMFLLEAEE